MKKKQNMTTTKKTVERSVESPNNGSIGEPATDKGLIAQLMRHSESIMRTLTTSTQYMTTRLQEENCRLADLLYNSENESLKSENLFLRELLQLVLSKMTVNKNEAKSMVDLMICSTSRGLESLLDRLKETQTSSSPVPEETKRNCPAHKTPRQRSRSTPHSRAGTPN